MRLFDELSAAQLRASGVRQIAVTGQVRLSPDRGRCALSFVRFLREATSAGVWVRWSGTVDPGLDVGLLCHLPPPVAESAAADSRQGRAWRAGTEAGLCYYRVGPGFVQVTDRRPGAAPRTVAVRSPAELELFGRLLVPGPVPDADDPQATAGELIRTRLILRIGEDAVTLPHRLTCRPVPWNVF